MGGGGRYDFRKVHSEPCKIRYVSTLAAEAVSRDGLLNTLAINCLSLQQRVFYLRNKPSILCCYASKV